MGAALLETHYLITEGQELPHEAVHQKGFNYKRCLPEFFGMLFDFLSKLKELLK